MKPLAIVLALVLAACAVFLFNLRSTLGGEVQRAEPTEQTPSLYALSTETLEGEPVDLEIYRGKVALVVNVASKCGLTPQYAGLQKLHEELEERGFTVLGFPSNDFREQEPGSPAEILAFCEKNYGVTFPLFAKRGVTGEKKDPVYRLLTRELEEPSWNFTKYLVDREGRVLLRFAPQTQPDDPELREKIEELLGA